MEMWFRLPSPEWAGSLLNLSLAVVSAAAAIYSSAVIPWVAELEGAIRQTKDPDGHPLNIATNEGARAVRQLRAVRDRDPARALGIGSLAIAMPMAALGVVAGLQIPNTGLVYTVVPVLVAALVAIGAAFLPGRAARLEAGRVLATHVKSP